MKCGGKSGLVGMIGAMVISFNEGWETTVGAMIELCCQKSVQVDIRTVATGGYIWVWGGLPSQYQRGPQIWT